MSAPIMIVEDDPYIRNTMLEVFNLMGREVIVAENGRKGIDLLKNMPVYRYPCCIILDLMMPEMNGEEFIFHIQALGRMELDSIPIIVSSADPKMQNLSSERVKYKLSKPIDLKDLEEIANTYN